MNTQTQSTSLSPLLAAAVFGALLSSHALVSAAAGSGARSTVVSYQDLNVSNPQGAARLYSRIVQSAQSVCGFLDADRFFSEISAEVSACVHKTVADAVRKVGNPQLIAVYNANNREPLPISLAAVQR